MRSARGHSSDDRRARLPRPAGGRGSRSARPARARLVRALLRGPDRARSVSPRPPPCDAGGHRGCPGSPRGRPLGLLPVHRLRRPARARRPRLLLVGGRAGARRHGDRPAGRADRRGRGSRHRLARARRARLPRARGGSARRRCGEAARFDLRPAHRRVLDERDRDPPARARARPPALRGQALGDPARERLLQPVRARHALRADGLRDRRTAVDLSTGPSTCSSPGSRSGSSSRRSTSG